MNNLTNTETQIDLELLLSKLIWVRPEGVTYNDVIDFKKRAIEALRENGFTVVFHSVSEERLKEVVNSYPRLFYITRFPEMTIHGYTSLPSKEEEYLHYFDSRTSNQAVEILDKVTQEYKQENTKKKKKGRAKKIQHTPKKTMPLK